MTAKKRPAVQGRATQKSSTTKSYQKTTGKNSRQSDWHDVTSDSPCLICNKPDWCTTNSDRSVALCRRNPDSAFTPGWDLTKNKTDRNDHPYGCWEHEPDVDADAAPPKSHVVVKIAPAKIRHKVYCKLLEKLPLTKTARDQLYQRGLVKNERKGRSYGHLGAERDKAVQAVIDAGLERHLPSVPGFYRTENEEWSFAGPRGILIPVRNLAGQITALKIRADKPLDGKKYIYASSKKRGGPSPGSPVHVPLHAAGPVKTIRITEGEIKADIATAKSGILTLGLPGVASFAKAELILRELSPEQVRISFDADYRTNTIVAEARIAAIKKFREMYEVVVEHWPEEWGKGVDDVLAAGRKPRLLTKAAVEKLARRHSARTTSIERPTIEITTEEKTVNDQAVAALGNDMLIFQRGNLLVHTLAEHDKPKGIIRPFSATRITAMPQAVLREHLAHAANWLGPNSKGVLQPAHPPKWSIEAVFSRGQWPGIRPLEGIVSGPVLRADGTILTTAGYDVETGLICEHSCEIPELLSKPTPKDVRRALKRLRDVVEDFPFELPVHEATWIAFLLTALAQYAYPGPAPLYLTDANTPGTGKGLLCDVASTIATGRPMSRMANPKDDDEARKRITAIAIASDRHVLIDNIDGTLGSPSMDAALTSETWKDRILGRSEIVELPLKTIWCATGNNVSLVGDLPRRVMRSRLITELEHPEERTGFSHPNLLAWVKEKRGELLAAALTLLRGYYADGRPSQGLPAWGSFEGWSDLVRSTVVWAGLADPAETRQELTHGADPKTQALAALMSGLQAFDPAGVGLTVSDIMRLLFDDSEGRMESAGWIRDALVQLCPTSNGSLAGPQKIGMTLHHLRKRNVGGRCLDSRQRNHSAAWYVRNIEQGTKGATGGISSPSRCKSESHTVNKDVNIKGAGKSPRSSRSPRKRSADTEVF